MAAEVSLSIRGERGAAAKVSLVICRDGRSQIMNYPAAEKPSPSRTQNATSVTLRETSFTV
jgi:hypothetical protein